MSKEKFSFQAEVGKILDVVAHSLYSQSEIFIREYISNASDACDKLRYESIKNPKLLKNTPDFKILIKIDPKLKTISVIDNGIGMCKDDMINNIAAIKSSLNTDNSLYVYTYDNIWIKNEELALLFKY